MSVRAVAGKTPVITVASWHQGIGLFQIELINTRPVISSSSDLSYFLLFNQPSVLNFQKFDRYFMKITVFTPSHASHAFLSGLPLGGK